MAKTGNSATEYHWNHAHIRHRIVPHYLDFDHYPLPFKSYVSPNQISLKPKAGNIREAGSLAELLFFAYGVTQARKTRGIPFFQRTVPSAGGLYPCHLYLAPGPGHESDNAETGVYYYDPVHTCLVQLRTGENPASAGIADLPAGLYRALFIITASFYNSAWKYRGRAYRYMLLDAGHLIRNLELVLGARGMSCGVDYDFSDRDAGALLNLDMAAEVPLACVRVDWDNSVSEILGQLMRTSVKDVPDAEARPFEALYMKNFGVLQQAHASGCSVQQPGGFKASNITDRPPVATLDTASSEEAAGSRSNSLETLILGRRSRRNFISAPVTRDAFLELLEWLRDGLAADNRGAEDGLLQTGMVCRNLEGMDDGFYKFDHGFNRVHLMDKGLLSPNLAGACLDQAWIGQAAITFLFFTNLRTLEKYFGSRGYRYMMMHAGRLGQQIYLGAESLGFGCCGIGAIYDEEACRLFDLNRDSALVYAVAAGPVKKRTGP
jgi:SagB-type dehydrogenase family enzyme